LPRSYAFFPEEQADKMDTNKTRMYRFRMVQFFYAIYKLSA
jgi:hypothetical protein